ncbi:hypothetical protein [Faecalispora jeddahensis]|uniref:hypothetical protein n=1 Tax=Faecalispora jeddahensis TaxID=1414721 RepID=UPI00145ACF79|nr:hypothetical protein [Faecalispora jeddahensis]
MSNIKKIVSLLLVTVLLAGSSVSASTVQATKNKAVFAPVSSNQKLELVSSTRKDYQDNGFDIVEETKIYDVIPSKSFSLARANAATKEKFVQKTKSLSHSNVGEVLIYTLDTTFEYSHGGAVNCYRYYSSYEIVQPEWVQSYEETDMKQTSSSMGTRKATIKTKYKFVISNGGSLKKTYTPSSSVWCDNRGNVGGN